MIARKLVINSFDAKNLISSSAIVTSKSNATVIAGIMFFLINLGWVTISQRCLSGSAPQSTNRKFPVRCAGTTCERGEYVGINKCILVLRLFKRAIIYFLMVCVGGCYESGEDGTEWGMA